MTDKTTYREMDKDFRHLVEEETGDPDFPFGWDLLSDNLSGMDRGNLGIIFARPEVGKTTFCAFLAANYIRNKQKVVYWANEEPDEKIKMRIIQSFFAMTSEEMKKASEVLTTQVIIPCHPFNLFLDTQM